MIFTLDKLQILCEIAQDAGREVMAVYGKEFLSKNKEDGSPLTEADLRADRVIRRGLQEKFPTLFILSEESGCSDNRNDETFFLVDPLDGTKEFLRRSGEFTVNIALVHQGEVVAGVVLAPALGELYFASKGQGAFKKNCGITRQLNLQTGDSKSALRVIGSRSHGSDALEQWLSKLAQPHTFVAAGSSLKFCRIAEGVADVYPRFGPTSQWDTAAAQCVLECSGGEVTDLSGNSLGYGLQRPLLNPEFIAFSPSYGVLNPI